MKFKVLILSALRNLKRNKNRSFLTMLGIIIGIASVITIVALGNAYKDKLIKDMTGENSGEIKLQANFANKDMKIDMSNQAIFSNLEKKSIEKLDQVDKVELAYGEDFFGSVTTVNIRDTDFQGFVEKVNSSSKPDIIGRDITESDNANNRKVVVISERILEASKFDNNKILGSLATINGINFEIIGIIPKPIEEKVSFSLPSDICIPENTHKKYLAKEKMPVGLDITLKKEMDVKESIKAIEDKLNEVGSKRQYGKYSVVDSSGGIKMLGSILNTLTLFISAVAGISLFIAGVGVMNMVYTSISERTLEIGIKRAIGAKKKDIRREFLLEGILITLTGGLIGYIVGIIVAMIISIFIKMKVSPDLFTASIAIGLSVLIGLLSSILPAKKAANANTIDILK
ncbi:ABC transporter permease [Clostridium gasigenes]|uniref:Putative ABC transport system permease protein n=1 Tax=Clostridium gasigenes TaxID=94869 RepID=A0A1H0Q2C9_9CLOT|nr:FtsX-like permease family protein [Clostridium gasigenes]MBU3088115.1 ABC transporter permease [Clostridium gasigenes]MBU3133775.1 ABC transporter permease [Clostridium gasigenes]SDP11607.1 putative ABC transport system permease protein [Clostridium gasigenes]